jgi:hypothetical protein
MLTPKVDTFERSPYAMETSASSTLAQLRQCVAQDDAIPASDTRTRLPLWIRTPLDSAIRALDTQVQAQGTTEGARIESSHTLQETYRLAEVLIRDVNRYLKGLPRSVDLSRALAHYGLQHGLDGGLPHARVEELLQIFVTQGSAATTPTVMHLRPTDILAASEHLATITAHKHTASVGGRAAVTEAKNAALDEAKTLRSRAYHYLCAALDGGTSDPLLTSYGFDPR